MGTRTAIFKEQADGTYQGIYCHWDGYIEGVGAVLYEHYQDPEKIQKVINQKKVPVLFRCERKRTLRIRQCRLSGTNLLWLARILSICSTRNRNVSCTIIRRNKRTTIPHAN